MMNNNLIVSDRFPSKKEINKRIKQSKKNNTNTKPDILKIVDLTEYLWDDDEVWISAIQKETLRIIEEIIELWINEYLQETWNEIDEDNNNIFEEVDLLRMEMMTSSYSINDTFDYLNDDDEWEFIYNESYILEAIRNLLEPYTDRVKLILTQN